MSRRWGSRRRCRSLPLTAALALLASLVPGTALVATVPGTALAASHVRPAASPSQQEVYVQTDMGNFYGLSAANPDTEIFQAGGGLASAGAMVVSPDSSAAYVAGASTSVYPYNTVQGTQGTPIRLNYYGYGPMAMSPNGATLYYQTGVGITEYTPATGKLAQDVIPVSGAQGLWGIAVSPDGSTLYASDNGGDLVDVINVATKTVTSTIALGGAPNTMVLSPDGSRLYVLEDKSNAVAVISTVSDTVVATISMPHVNNLVMNLGDSACISPDGSTLYVPGSPGEPEQVVSTSTDTITSTLLPPNLNEFSCAVSPDGSQVWVGMAGAPALTGGVVVFNASTHAIIGQNELDNGNVLAIAFGPDQAPNAALAVTPGPEYQSTQFDASASTSPYSTITNYAWNFGDGTTANTTTPTTSHVYTSPGPFTATVTETDAIGTSTASTTVVNGTENMRTGGPQAQASQTFSPLPPAAVVVSGVVSYPSDPDCTGNTGGGTTPLAGATVTMVDNQGNVVGTTTTDSGGNYSVKGLYEPGQQIQVSGTSALSPAVPGQFDLSSGIGLTGNTTQNLTLPNPVLENVSVTDTTGHPISGATVSEAAADPTAPFALTAGATAGPGTQTATSQATDDTGQATLCLYPSPAAHLTATSGARQGSATVDTSGGTASIVIPTLPSVGVSSSSLTSQYKQPVTFTAAAGPNGSGGPVPTGSVTFTVDGVAQNPVTLSPSGQASLTLNSLTSGTHSVTATYSGDSVYATATSAPLTQTVLPDTTTTTLTSTAQPSVTGQAAAVSATVTSGPGQGTPTGTVTFTVDGSQQPAVALVSGKASVKLTSLAAGTHTISAAYSGDTNHVASTSAPFTQVVNQDATSAGLTTTRTPGTYGQAGSITVKVKANSPGSGTPTGTVTFSVDGTAGQPVALSAGKATMSLAGLGAGSHQITATYSGDQNYLGTTSAALTQVINQASTTTALTTPQNPVQQGAAGAIIAKVKDVLPGKGAATGTVTFTVNGVAGHPVPLTAFDTARLALAKLAAGANTITATYNGDTNHAASTSTQLVEVVNPPAPFIHPPEASNPASA
jgi:YVTN family beta-propeller protein